MRLTKFFQLFILLASVSIACTDSKKPVVNASERIEKTVSQQDREKFEKEHTFEYSGYVRSVLQDKTRFSGESLSGMLIGFESEDGSLIKIRFAYLEPRVWKGMHAKIVIRQLYSEKYGSMWEVKDFNSGDPVYKVLDVKRLTKKP